MTENVKLYRYIEPATPAYPSANSELYEYTYRTFAISRAGTEYLFWSIKTPDGTELPSSLRSSFTTRQRAEAAIDAFLEQERIKQAKFEGAN